MDVPSVRDQALHFGLAGPRAAMDLMLDLIWQNRARQNDEGAKEESRGRSDRLRG